MLAHNLVSLSPIRFLHTDKNIGGADSKPPKWTLKIYASRSCSVNRFVAAWSFCNNEGGSPLIAARPAARAARFPDLPPRFYPAGETGIDIGDIAVARVIQRPRRPLRICAINPNIVAISAGALSPENSRYRVATFTTMRSASPHAE